MGQDPVPYRGWGSVRAPGFLSSPSFSISLCVPSAEFTFSPNTGSLLQSAVVEDKNESAMRQCFSDAFDKEVRSHTYRVCLST